VATRVQATRDGTLGHHDATYIMAYISSPQTVTLNTGVMAAQALKVSWFNPATGASEVMAGLLANPGNLQFEPQPAGDRVVVIEDAAKNQPPNH